MTSSSVSTKESTLNSQPNDDYHARCTAAINAAEPHEREAAQQQLAQLRDAYTALSQQYSALSAQHAQLADERVTLLADLEAHRGLYASCLRHLATCEELLGHAYQLASALDAPKQYLDAFSDWSGWDSSKPLPDLRPAHARSDAYRRLEARWRWFDDRAAFDTEKKQWVLKVRVAGHKAFGPALDDLIGQEQHIEHIRDELRQLRADVEGAKSLLAQEET